MPLLLNRLIDAAASHSPDAAAVRCAGQALSYQQLARRANGLARVLLAAGLKRRDRVAVLLGKGLEVPVSFYGVLAAGGTLVPIDPKSPADRVAAILRSTRATHLIAEPSKNRVLRQALAQSPDLDHVIGCDPGAEVDATFRSHPWESVSAEACDSPPDVPVIDLDPSYILHTSGSTGTPKLILHTHRSAMSFVEWAVSEYSLTSDDRLSNHSSHHTCFATFDYYAAAGAGATTVILTPAMLMMPGSLSALLEEERVSVWYSVPAALIQLSLRGNLETHDLGSLRWVLFAGETFPEKHLRRLMEQIPKARFSHVYGSTEVNVCTCYHLPGASEITFPLPIGRACSNSATEVVDTDLRPVPRGEAGELLVRGSTVMSGYWADPERNRQVLLRRASAGDLEEVYFRTGDRVTTRDDGNLTFVARTDLQVKIRGHRIELEEVESALMSLDSIEEAAAFTVPDDEGSSSLRSAVVVANQESAEGQQIMTELKSLLPSYSVPAGIVVLDTLPRTPTGKIDRDALANRSVGQESR